MTALPMDSNGNSRTVAALVWTLQDKPDAADRCLAHLDLDQTLLAWEAVEALQRRLTAHYRELAAVPAVPDWVEGFEVHGRVAS